PTRQPARLHDPPGHRRPGPRPTDRLAPGGRPRPAHPRLPGRRRQRRDRPALGHGPARLAPGQPRTATPPAPPAPDPHGAGAVTARHRGRRRRSWLAQPGPSEWRRAANRPDRTSGGRPPRPAELAVDPPPGPLPPEA